MNFFLRKPRFLSLLLAGGLLLSLSGCLASVPLGERTIVLALGIDRVHGVYEATMQLDNSQEGVENAGKSVTVRTARGNSMTELLSHAAVEQGRQLFISSMRLVVIGEATAREGCAEIFSFLNTDRQLDPTLPIGIAKGSAGELVAAVEENPDLTAQNLQAMQKNACLMGQSPKSRLMDLTGAFCGENRTGTAALFELVRGTDKSPPTVQVGGQGLFYGDKLERLLDAQKTRGLSWVQNEVAFATASVEDPEIGNASIVMDKAHTHIEAQLLGDNPVFAITLDVEGTLQEEPLLRPLDAEQRAYLEALQAQALRLEIEDALHESLREGYDPLGLSQLMKQRHPQYYEENRTNWEQVMQSSGYPVEVRCKLHG